MEIKFKDMSVNELLEELAKVSRELIEDDDLVLVEREELILKELTSRLD